MRGLPRYFPILPAEYTNGNLQPPEGDLSLLSSFAHSSCNAHTYREGTGDVMTYVQTGVVIITLAMLGLSACQAGGAAIAGDDQHVASAGSWPSREISLQAHADGSFQSPLRVSATPKDS